MTKQLQRYIARHIFYATLIVSCIIIGVLFVLTLLNELRNVGEGGYGVSDALFYVMMRLPGLAYQFSAFLILLGSIVGLSMLITHREIMAMRVSGFSMRHIIASTLSAAFLFALLLSVMGEWLAPKLNNIAEINKENSRNAGEALVTSHGVWLHIGDNFVHFSQVINHHLLEGVTRYQFDRHHRLVSVYYAKRLLFQNDAWHMQDAVKTTFTVNHAVSQAFQELDWDLQWNVGFLDHEERSPDEMSLKELSTSIHYLNQNGLQSSGYQYAFWERIFQPLASLMMVFIAIPCMFQFLQSTALGMRVVIGVVVGIVFFILNALFGQICVVYQVPAILAAVLPLVIVILAGVSLLSFSRSR